eukprot:scaffold36557_cov45-Cyclotella_meneghiniana.AAC.3
MNCKSGAMQTNQNIMESEDIIIPVLILAHTNSKTSKKYVGHKDAKASVVSQYRMHEVACCKQR